MIKDIQHIGPCTLIHGDALLVLPHLTLDGPVDALITDQPYSSGGLTRSDRNQPTQEKYQSSNTMLRRHSFTGDHMDSMAWQTWCAMWLSMARVYMREGAYSMIFSDWRQVPAASAALQAGGFVWRGMIAWDKTEGARAPHTGYYRHQSEYVLWGSLNTLPKAHGPWAGVLREPIRQSEKHHLTGKPVRLMRHLTQCAGRGALVLDPFMGSGTTAIAAIQEGQRFVGIELDPHYYEVAVERVSKEVRRGAGAAG